MLTLSRARVFLIEVPRTAKLAYCLLRDDRVPLPPKLAVAAALGLIFSPLDVPAWIPVVGDLDVLAMGILAVKVFVDACPEAVVEEHRAALAAGQSVFDHDLRFAGMVARSGVRRLASGWRGRLALAPIRESEEEPA